MRSLQFAPGVIGWTHGTYHQPLPEGLPDRTPVTVVWMPFGDGHCIVVRDPEGILWRIQHWVVEIGRWVTVGGRKLPEWHPEALAETERQLAKYLRRAAGCHRHNPCLWDWKTLAEYAHWELVRNGRTPADLPWEREEPQAGWAYQVGRCEEVMPGLFREITTGVAPPVQAPRTSPARSLR